MSLEDEDAIKLLSGMPIRDVERVSLEIAKMDSVSGEEQEQVIAEFMSSRVSSLSHRNGGLERAKDLVKKAFGKDAADMLAVLQQTMESLPFGFLQKADPQNIVSFLMDEHPQTIAIVVSHLPAQSGAAVIAGLQGTKQLAVIRRIAEMGQTTPEAINEVESALSKRMALFSTQSFDNAGGVPAVAEILNVSDRTTERTVLESLGADSPDLVDEIRRLMFVFDDVAKFGDKEIQTLLKNVETQQWAMALKGSSQELQDKVLRNLSQRAGETLREEMEFLGRVKLSDVESVQQQIVDIVRMLEDSGQLTRPSDSAEEEFVA